MSTRISFSSRNAYLATDYSHSDNKFGPRYILSSETREDLIPTRFKIDAIINKYNLQSRIAKVASEFHKQTPPSLKTLFIESGFKQAEWKLSHSFKHLMEELDNCKYLYAYGYFAKGNYKKLNAKKQFHDKQIIFLNKFDTNPLLDVDQLKKQAIVIVGAIEQTKAGTVLYIDPTEGDQNPNIYGIEYEEFCKYVLPLDQENHGVDSCYLVKSVKATMSPSNLPPTPRKNPTPLKLIEPTPLEGSALTSKIQSVVFKACDLKAHHIRALGLLLNQYDQKAKNNAIALNTGFEKYWIQEMAIEKESQFQLDTTVNSLRLKNFRNLMIDLGYFTSLLHSDIQKIPPEQALLKLEEQFSNAFISDFGFQMVPFTPLTVFADFKKELKAHRFLYAFGHFVTNNGVSEMKIQTVLDKEVFCLEGATFINKQFSSIVLCGCVDTELEQSILFITPENKSTNQTFYKLDYATFCQLVRTISDDVDFDSDSYLLKYQGS